MRDKGVARRRAGGGSQGSDSALWLAKVLSPSPGSTAGYAIVSPAPPPKQALPVLTPPQGGSDKLRPDGWVAGQCR